MVSSGGGRVWENLYPEQDTQGPSWRRALYLAGILRDRSAREPEDDLTSPLLLWLLRFILTQP
jgi:hypothetical protein